MTRDAVRKAYEYGVVAGVAPVLVGTAGLWMHGYAVDQPDINFLCEADPDRAAYGSPEVKVDGYVAQYIAAPDGGQRAYYHPKRADLIDGVLVATVEDIIGLKRWRDREKDREFLRGWDAQQRLLDAAASY